MSKLFSIHHFDNKAINKAVQVQNGKQRRKRRYLFRLQPAFRFRIHLESKFWWSILFSNSTTHWRRRNVFIGPKFTFFYARPIITSGDGSQEHRTIQLLDYRYSSSEIICFFLFERRRMFQLLEDIFNIECRLMMY